MAKTPNHAEWAPLAFEHFDLRQIIGGVRARYPAASDFTFAYEGGYVNDPDDPGGCTHMGITIGTLRGWREDPDLTCEDVKALTKDEAALIYATNYWAPVWGNELPVGLNTQVYDWGVNSGPATAIRYLQELVGSPKDGVMGPATLQATRDYSDSIGIETACRAYHDKRQVYYQGLSSFSKYGTGWTNRNNDCLDLALELADNPAIPNPTQGLLTSRVARLEAWAASFKETT